MANQNRLAFQRTDVFFALKSIVSAAPTTLPVIPIPRACKKPARTLSRPASLNSQTFSQHRSTAQGREIVVFSGKSTVQCSRSPATFQDSELAINIF